MKRKILSAISLIAVFTLLLPLFASCNVTYYYDREAWSYKGAIDMTTGEKLENAIYEGTKSYEGLLGNGVTSYTPTVLYKDEFYGKINLSALFHDQSESYLKGKTSSESVTLKFRTAKGNADSVSLVTRSYKGKENTEVRMTVSHSDNYFDYYTATLSPSSERRFYLFKITSGQDVIYYTASLTEKSLPNLSQNNWFILTPDFSTPEWSHGTVWYSIFPDSFFNGDTLNDAGAGSYYGAISRPWGTARTGYEYPMKSSVTGKDYYGGDLTGIYAKIGYLKETLGVESIYTNPIFESTFNVGYGPDDYLTVSRYYGTNNELAELISVLHDNGMKFITDGVWLYSGRNSKEYNANGFWPEKGAFQSAEVSYKDFYYALKNKDWPNVQTVYNENVFKINFDTDFTKDYIFRKQNSALLYFLNAPYNMDGWRLDVPAYNKNSTNGFEIEEQFRAYMNSVNPETILIGETTVLPEERYGTALDSVWNYGDFAEHIYLYFDAPRNHPGDESSGYKTTVSYNADELLKKVATSVNKVPFDVAKSGYNLISSHDVARVLTNLNGNESKAILAAVMQFTMVGSPVIYYGDEIGMEGHSASFGNMQSFNWNEKSWNYNILNSYKSLLNLRKDFSGVLSNGGFMPLLASSEPDVLSYARFNENEAVITAINNGKAAETIEIPVYKLGLYNDGDILWNYETGEGYRVENGIITVSVAKESSAIIVKSEKRSGYFGGFISADIGTVPVLGTTVLTDKAVILSGSGYLESVNDNFRLYGKNVFGAVSVSADLSASVNGAGVMIRESESIYAPFVSLTVKDGKAIMEVREREGGDVIEVASLEISSETVCLKITRDQFNKFTAFVSDTEVGSRSVAMKEGVVAGIFAAGGETTVTAEFSSLSVTEDTTPIYDKFESSVPAAIYTKIAKKYSVSGGKLTLFTEGKTARMLSAFSSEDFSVTVGLSETDGEAGLTVYQDEQNVISLVKNGSKLYLKSKLSGLLITEAEAEISNGKVYLHLQRAGTYISAYYSTDGESYKRLGDLINANFSEIYGGMTAIGGTEAVFEEFTAGDMINGKNALITNKDSSKTEIQFTNAVSHTISYGEGAWKYTDAGFVQTDKGIYASCDYIGSNVAPRHIFDATVELLGGKGSAGISFGKRNITDKATESGFYLAIFADGRVVLYSDGTEIASASEKINPKSQNRIRIIADEQTGISVYLNDNPEAAITAKITLKKLLGSLSLITDKSSAAFRNVTKRSYLSGFESYSTLGYTAEMSGTVKNNITDYGLLLGHSGRVFDDFTVKANFSITNLKENGYAGVLVRAKTGEYPELSGALIYFKKGAVGVSYKGITVEEVAYDISSGKRLKPEITVKGKEIAVIIDGNEILRATVSDVASSGAVEFITTYSTCSVYDFKINP